MKVLVSIPNMGNIHKHVAMAVERILKDTRYQVTVIYPTWVPYEHNLHRIRNQFIRDGFDFWINIDSDNPPFGNPLDLIELDRDIIGLPTPVVHYTGAKEPGIDPPVYLNAYQLHEDGYKPWPITEKLQEVDAIGSGCMVIAKRVFGSETMMGPVFLRKWNQDGTVERGTDIAFCERAIAHGFKVWAHFDYPCRHFNTVEIQETVNEFSRYFNG